MRLRYSGEQGNNPRFKGKNMRSNHDDRQFDYSR